MNFSEEARKAEQKTGWGRETVNKGLKELKSGIVCRDNFQGRGRKRTEENLPSLKNDIQDIAEPHAQTDPDFKNNLLYIKITAENFLSVRKDIKMRNFRRMIQ